MAAYGKKVWLIPDCYLNSVSKNPNVSHEAICVINTSDTDAEIKLTLYFEDRPAMDGFVSHCGARKTHHIRMDKLCSADGQPIPRDTPYAAPVSYTHLDVYKRQVQQRRGSAPPPAQM